MTTSSTHHTFGHLNFELIAYGTVSSTQDIAKAWLRREGRAGESTSAELALELPKQAVTTNTILRAAAQHGGHGQQRRNWQSHPGGSYQTVLIHPDNLPQDKTKLACSSLWIGLSIAKQLRKLGDEVFVKWPNDLYWQEKKIAGILCEQVRGWLVVGVGVNVLNPIPETAKRLAHHPLEVVHTCVLEGISQGLQALNGQQSLSVSFQEVDFLAGRSIRLHAQQLLDASGHVLNHPANTSYTAHAAGIHDAGWLAVTISDINNGQPVYCRDGRVLAW
jgi:BirA family biotin operon repressor/biotin-[acetyl-CoA-carboxylase] ligase